jgi:hypothetical protein
MSKDIKRGGLKNGKNLGWVLKVGYSGDGSSFVAGDTIPIGNKISIGRNSSNHMVDVLYYKSVEKLYPAYLYVKRLKFLIRHIKRISKE